MTRSLTVSLAALALVAAASSARAQMPDPRQVSGVPLPATDLPSGTISVRVIRGSFANNVAGADVTFVVDGQTRTASTDANGRAEVSGLRLGSHVKAFVVLDGQRLETQEVTVNQGGFRFVLAGAPPAGSAGTAPAAVKGTVMISADSRIVAEFTQDNLDIYYVLKILNQAAAPVDLGGPLEIALPTGARGVGLLEDTTSQAKVNGARVTVTGPFAPGTTAVSIGYELPYSGATAHVEQRWPVKLEGAEFFAVKTGSIDANSAQFSTKQSETEQGQLLVVGLVQPMTEGQTFAFDITGLPHHPTWPRYTALGLAGTILAVGLWAAFVPPRRRDEQD